MKKGNKLFYAALVLIAFTVLAADAAVYMQSQTTTNTFLSGVMKLLQPWLQWEIDILMVVVLINPTVYCWPNVPGCEVSAGLDKLQPYFEKIVVPLYIVAILFTALYYIVKSTNPRGRARAKSMLSKLLFSMVLVSMAPIVYQTLIDLSNSLSTSIYTGYLTSEKMNSLTEATTGGEIFGVCCLVIITIIVILFALIMSGVRYFFVIVFAALFPILLFLYFFDLTRSWGRKYIREAVNWIFTPVVQLLWLVFTVSALNSTGSLSILEWPAISGSQLMGIVVSWGMALVGIVLVGITPLLMNQLMNLVGGGFFALGVATNNTWVTALGGVMEGRQDAGLHAAKSVLTRSTPTASAINALQFGYGAGVGKTSTAFGPETVARSMGGGVTEDEGAFGEDSSGGGLGGGGPVGGGGGGGPSGRARRVGGGARSQAADAAKREVQAMEERGSGPVGARGGSIATRAPPGGGGDVVDRSLGSRLPPVVPKLQVDQSKAGGGGNGTQTATSDGGVEGSMEGVSMHAGGYPTTPRTLKPTSPETSKGGLEELKKEAEGGGYEALAEAEKESANRVYQAKKDITTETARERDRILQEKLKKEGEAAEKKGQKQVKGKKPDKKEEG